MAIPCRLCGRIIGHDESCFIFDLERRLVNAVKERDELREELDRPCLACYTCGFTGEPKGSKNCPSCGNVMSERSVHHEWEKLLGKFRDLEAQLARAKEFAHDRHFTRREEFEENWTRRVVEGKE